MGNQTAPLILHVMHHLVVGGMQNGLVNIINRMPADKYRHVIACVEDYDDFRLRIARPDVEVIALHRSKIGVWAVRKEFYRLCRELHPSILHTRNLSALDAIVPARLAGVERCIHGEHGWDVSDLDGTKMKPVILRRLHAPFIDHYITVSLHLKQYLVDRIGIDPSRITHICNGVDTEKFAPNVVSNKEVFPAGFLDAYKILIGTVGRLDPVKDQGSLLRAFASLLQISPDDRNRYRLVVVGDGTELVKLRGLASELGIGEVSWFPGATDNVNEILHRMDIFVLPSLQEGISNTILEAMAAGVPVVATAVGGNVELVHDGQTGRLFLPGDTGKLSRILLEYSNNPGLRETHGSRARTAAIENFSLKSMVDSYQAVYDEQLGK